MTHFQTPTLDTVPLLRTYTQVVCIRVTDGIGGGGSGELTFDKFLAYRSRRNVPQIDPQVGLNAFRQKGNTSQLSWPHDNATHATTLREEFSCQIVTATSSTEISGRYPMCDIDGCGGGREEVSVGERLRDERNSTSRLRGEG